LRQKNNRGGRIWIAQPDKATSHRWPCLLALGVRSSPLYLTGAMCCFIGIDVQLTVQTFPQKEQCHAVDMKQVAAARASAKGSQERRYQQEHEPDTENSPHGPVRGDDEIGDKQGRDIDQHGDQKK